ncbi:MAG: lipopolysaccharide biosynthesis protein [Alphaproteobacteria bacterium]|nr:lipopolysaccharide biosynthesis protein [Alphaproteobacteria bacterium]
MSVHGRRSELIRRLRPFALNYVASGASLGLAAGAQLVTFALLARHLGPAEFGQLVAVTAFIAIAAPFCGLGALEGLVRRTAARRSDYAAMLGHALVLIAITGTLLVAAGIVGLPFVFPLSPDAGAAFLATALMLGGGIVLGNIVNLSEHACMAHGRFGAANAIVAGFALARTATAAIACIAFDVTTAAGWADWFFACHLVSAGAAFWAIRGLGRPRFGLVREELVRGTWFSLPILARALRQNVDLIVLGLVAGGATLASYGIARRILDVSYLSIGALSRLVYPGSAMAAAKGIGPMLDRARSVLVGALGVGALTAAAVWLAAPLLPLIFGSGYVALPGFARALCGLLIVSAGGVTALDALAASGRHGKRAAVLGLGSLAGAALVAAGCAAYGPDGAISAAYVADTGVAVLAWILLLRLAQPARIPASPVPA